jgi:hypothetical protein
MSEILYFLLKELVVLELYAGFSEPVKHFPQVEQVLLESVANDNHVFQVQET